ncbi:MAG: serine protease [Clostridia bacterium]|nr:serine protease [Clostridia bacterium]
MAKYRFYYPHKKQKIAESWREPPSEEDARYLDLQEIERLNSLPEQQTPARRRRLPIAIVVVVMVLVFIGFAAYGVLPYAKLPNLGFIKKSAEFKQDEAVALLQQAVVQIQGAASSGTGFNVAAEGVIITNAHVVDNDQSLLITFADGQSFAADEWELISGYDLAIIKITGQGLPFVPLAETYFSQGEKVMFIGNPLGFNWTVAEGEVLEYLKLADNALPVLLLSGTVYPGSSGSPVFNAQGQVGAVVYAMLTDQENTGLAIPVQALQGYID